MSIDVPERGKPDTTITELPNRCRLVEPGIASGVDTCGESFTRSWRSGQDVPAGLRRLSLVAALREPAPILLTHPPTTDRAQN